MKKRSIKRIHSLLFVFVFMMLFVTAVPVFAKTKKIRFTKSSITITKGKTVKVKAKGSYKKIKVKASKKGRVKISVKGKTIRIKALRTGNLKLYVRGYNKKGKLIGKGTIKVKIKAKKKVVKKAEQKKTEQKKETGNKTTTTTAAQEPSSAGTSKTNSTASTAPKQPAYVYNEDSANLFLKAVKKVADKARKNGWYYGDSHSTPPCDDKKISCDRIIARALYDLGYTEQPGGGITIHNMAPYLAGWGFVSVSKSKIRPGAVVAIKDINDNTITHVFVVSKYDPKTEICNKYDTGADWRIQSKQPFKNVPLIEWPSARKFMYAYNVPYALKGTAAYAAAQAVKTKAYIFNGVDYSAVYNYQFYRTNYEDLRKAFGKNEAAYFTHFLTYGMVEGRQACSGFRVERYSKRYPDINNLYGTNLPEYYKHYCLYGKAEGRIGF